MSLKKESMTFPNRGGDYYYCALPSSRIPNDILLCVYIYDLNRDLDISKDCMQQATKKSKNNMHGNFASTCTMNFVVADADLVL